MSTRESLRLTKCDEQLHEYFFFFQAEDGIRDLTVTGVQTCALPISIDGLTQRIAAVVARLKGFARRDELRVQPVPVAAAFQAAVALVGAEARRQRVDRKSVV